METWYAKLIYHTEWCRNCLHDHSAQNLFVKEAADAKFLRLSRNLVNDKAVDYEAGKTEPASVVKNLRRINSNRLDVENSIEIPEDEEVGID